jgi:hypothetical protein
MGWVALGVALITLGLALGLWAIYELATYNKPRYRRTGK